MVHEDHATNAVHEDGHTNGNGYANGNGYTSSSTSGLEIDSTWVQNATTVAGGNRWGTDLGRLNFPSGIYVDDDETVYVCDYSNNRVVEWKSGEKTGRVIAGDGDKSGRTERLRHPKDILFDKASDSFIIADEGNKRVVQWPREQGSSVKTIVTNVTPAALAMDEDGDLYVSDFEKHDVKRYTIGDPNGTLVAGGNGKGAYLKQLSSPTCIFVDKEKSVYVSDWANHRIVKWVVGTKVGVIVAGGNKSPHNPMSMSDPFGVFVDQFKNIYVADWIKHRIVRYTEKSTTECTMVVGQSVIGKASNELYHPMCFVFDKNGNLFVSDFSNHRVQKFNINTNSITN